MAKKDDTPKKSSSVFEEIEEQLEQALAKKKEDIEKELEERIRQEKEETQRRIEGLDKELKQERGALIDIQSQLDEFENQKAPRQAHFFGNTQQQHSLPPDPHNY